MLKQRVMTALLVGSIFAVVMLSNNAFLFMAFWLLVVALAAGEWAKLIALPRDYAWAFVVATVLLCASAMGVSLWYRDEVVSYLPVWAAALLWLFGAPYFLWRYAVDGSLCLSKKGLFLLGILLLLAFSSAVIIALHHVGGGGLLGLFVLIWCADIGAFFVGRALGRVPLAATISPKKTREGFIGGWVFSMLAAMLYYWLIHPDVSLGRFMVVSAVVLIYATLGDLFESVLKRQAGLKDSGQVLPGHGGVLDRIDSWLPAMVLWAAMFLWVGGQS